MFNERTTPLTQVTRTHFLSAAAAVALLAAGSSHAQSYQVIDLTPTAGNATAKGVFGADAGGSVAPAVGSALFRATLWNENGQTDLHPASLVGATAANPGRSGIEAVGNGFAAGWAAGPTTGNRNFPVLWRGDAAVPSLLDVPFANGGGQVLSTDGIQIVGFVWGLDELGQPLTSHAVVWDAATGVATDLGDGGKGAQAIGAGGGAQVGYVVKSVATAALWRGSDRSLISLHPRDAVMSVANATDGVRQVGYSGYDIRVRQEAAKGNKTARFNYAMVWSGSAASAVNIHPGAPVNSTTVLAQSYALGMAGGAIVGYGVPSTVAGVTTQPHALVWDQSLTAVDLNAFLPAGFVGAIAYSVDAQGQIAGFMNTADGRRHAALWVPVAAAQP